MVQNSFHPIKLISFFQVIELLLTLLQLALTKNGKIINSLPNKVRRLIVFVPFLLIILILLKIISSTSSISFFHSAQNLSGQVLSNH